jgi:hypothetical protein
MIESMTEYTEAVYDDLDELDGLSKFDRKALKGLYDYLDMKLKEAEDAGWKRPEVVFESHTDYDGYTEPPTCYILGLRLKNKKELDDDRDRLETSRIANKLGISEYEARIVQNLKKRNKLGDLI